MSSFPSNDPVLRPPGFNRFQDNGSAATLQSTTNYPDQGILHVSRHGSVSTLADADAPELPKPLKVEQVDIEKAQAQEEDAVNKWRATETHSIPHMYGVTSILQRITF